jgi:hypothetical protein
MSEDAGVTALWIGAVCLAVSFAAGLPADYARRRATRYASVAQIANVLVIVGTIAGLATTGDLHGWRIVAVVVGVFLGQFGADRFATQRWGPVPTHQSST